MSKARSKSLVKPSASEMCPPGYHVVHGHERVCKSGAVTWVDAHIRKNRGKIRPGLLKENIHFLFWNSKKKYSTLNDIKGFEGLGSEYDQAIQFWLDYWKEQGIEFPEDLDPLMIKAMIAAESSFDPSIVTKAKNSTAAGLMQITDQSLRVLGGLPDKNNWTEMRQHLLHVGKGDNLDPIVSIALGTRLLGHKYSQLGNSKDKSARQVIRNYHSKNSGGDAYAKKVCLFMKSLEKRGSTFVFLLVLIIFLNALADPPIEDPNRTFLQLGSGKWLSLKKTNWEFGREKFEFLYGIGKGNEKKKRIIWSKVYETNPERAWEYAYFLRLKPGRFLYDLDGDGNKEVGVATYDMGNNMFRKILIFTIHKDRVVFMREHGPYNIAADEPVFR